MTWLFFLLILGGIAFYFTTPAERARFLQLLRSTALAVRDGGLKRRADQAPFFAALRERTRVPFVTIALLLVNLVVYARMAAGDGAMNDAGTLIAWGANFGPRTTNGEWWRLLAAMFVHRSFLELLITLACLGQLGFLLERLVGHTAFCAVYLSAAAFASLVSLVVAPVGANAGASGALFGLYGLLLSVLFWSALNRTPLSIPWRILKDLLPGAVVFLVYQLFTASSGGWVELAGLSTGTITGLVLTRGIGEFKPPARRIAVVASAAMVLTLVCTLPLRGITDARPEVASIVAAETRATTAYRAIVVRFNEGLVPATAMTRVIDQQILPELRMKRVRLAALSGVPREHQPMVAAAQDYLRLREESWRLRREALQRTNMVILGKADRTEWESLEALKKIRSGA